MGKYELILLASITASAHVMGTVILGIALGMVGSKLAHQYEGYVHVIAPVLLIIFGLIYFTVNLPHHHTANKDVQYYKKYKTKWVLILAATIVFIPLPGSGKSFPDSWCLWVEWYFIDSPCICSNQHYRNYHTRDICI